MFFEDDKGVSALEYGLIAAATLVAIHVALPSIGQKVGAMFQIIMLAF